MDWEPLIQILLTYGPGGLIAALLIFGILVPKSFYDREVKRGDVATETASKNAESLKQVTTALTAVAAENVSLTKAVTDQREEIRALRDDVRSLRPPILGGSA